MCNRGEFRHCPSASQSGITRSGTISNRGGNNGTVIQSGGAFEERTGKSTSGSSTFYCRARSFGKLKLKCAPYIVGVGSKEDQPRTEKAVGAGSKRIAASSGEDHLLGSCETHSKNISGSQKENRGCRTSTLGEVQSGEEESGLELETGLYIIAMATIQLVRRSA